MMEFVYVMMIGQWKLTVASTTVPVIHDAQVHQVPAPVLGLQISIAICVAKMLIVKSRLDPVFAISTGQVIAVICGRVIEIQDVLILVPAPLMLIALAACQMPRKFSAPAYATQDGLQ